MEKASSLLFGTYWADLPETDSEMEVSMPASIREVKEGKKTVLTRGRSWTVIQPQQRLLGNSKTLMILQARPR